MEFLLSLDEQLLLKINRDWTTTWTDAFFPLITDLHRDPVFAVLLIASVVVGLLTRLRWRSGIVLFTLVLGLAASDLFGSRVVKPVFGRLRPDQAGVDVILRAPHYSGASFTSNHAANMFCFATFLAFLFPKLRVYLLSIAALVAYSRVYCGVHYPLDVMFGALQGSVIGGLFALMLLRSRHNPFRGEAWPKS